VSVIVGFGGYFFYVLASLVLLSAFMVVSSKNPVHSAMFLVFTFFCVAGIYITMSAEFIAAVQVLVYAGGIVVLFLFVIMLVPLRDQLRPLRIKQGAAALLLAAIVGSAVIVVYDQARGTETSSDISAPLGSIESVGMELYTRYLLPFELASVLLLVAMVGAIVLARRQV
jgi:NADH-quinone oxidoreductase subunit J